MKYINWLKREMKKDIKNMEEYLNHSHDVYDVVRGAQLCKGKEIVKDDKTGVLSFNSLMWSHSLSTGLLYNSIFEMHKTKFINAVLREE